MPRRPRSASSSPDIRVPSLLRCALWMAVVKFSLKTRGFGETMRWIRRRVAPIYPVDGVREEVLEGAERAVAVAGALYPGRGLCLEQSLVLYYILRRQGVPVRYCQGVQAHPFAAHAWIEYRGEPLTDIREHVQRFARLPDLLP